MRDIPIPNPIGINFLMDPLEPSEIFLENDSRKSGFHSGRNTACTFEFVRAFSRLESIKCDANSPKESSTESTRPKRKPPLRVQTMQISPGRVGVWRKRSLRKNVFNTASLHQLEQLIKAIWTSKQKEENPTSIISSDHRQRIRTSQARQGRGQLFRQIFAAPRVAAAEQDAPSLVCNLGG